MPNFAKTSLFKAFIEPYRHPLESAKKLYFGKGQLESTDKVLNVFAQTINVAHLINPSFPEFPTYLSFSKSVKELTKTLKVFYLIDDVEKGTLWTKIKERSKHITVPGYVIKQAALVTATVSQIWIFSGAYVHPVFFNTVSSEFVKQAGAVSARIGGNRLVAVTAKVTGIGVRGVLNYSLIVFLALEGYDTYCNFRETFKSAKDPITGNLHIDKLAKAVYQEMKTVEFLGKVVIISMVVSGVSAYVIIPVGFGIALLGLAAQTQKINIELDKE